MQSAGGQLPGLDLEMSAGEVAVDLLDRGQLLRGEGGELGEERGRFAVGEIGEPMIVLVVPDESRVDRVEPIIGIEEAVQPRVETHSRAAEGERNPAASGTTAPRR
jgi:hypothetical protein